MKNKVLYLVAMFFCLTGIVIGQERTPTPEPTTTPTPASSVQTNIITNRQIENLPFNERNITNPLLTISTVKRGNERSTRPTIDPSFNINGQRETLFRIDGADFNDQLNIPLEAVQELRVIGNNSPVELGRGGTVNIITNRGGNNFRGNIFGFILDDSTQARYPFDPLKTSFTRGQFGGNLAGKFIQDKAFFFVAYERRQENESGFFTKNVAQGLNGSVTVNGQAFTQITTEQQRFAQNLITTGNPTLIQTAISYLYLASSGGNTGLTGNNPLININNGQPIGQRFFLSGAPVPINSRNAAGQPIAFRPLLDLQKVFPITDHTNLFSLRTDFIINEKNQLALRFSYNPSTITGIQAENQNQSLGEIDFSRSANRELKDLLFTAGLNSDLSQKVVNELRFNYSRRKTSFVSQNSDAVAFNVPGAAFIGQENFQPTDSMETRFQIADRLGYNLRKHYLNFGADFNFLTSKEVYEINQAGLFNFADFDAGSLNQTFAALNAPNFTAVQSYGLGLPQNFIQQFGKQIGKTKNNSLAFFAGDSWNVSDRLTLDFGIRYNAELVKKTSPASFRDPVSLISLSATDLSAAQNAVNVQQNLPSDKNNFAPRFGFAFDTFGNGKSVIRGGIGRYYDRPVIPMIINSEQIILSGGSPNFTALLNATQVFQGTVCSVASNNPICPPGFITPGTAPSAQYQFNRQRFNNQNFPGFGSTLPATSVVSKDFQLSSTTQANLSFEQKLSGNTTLTISYIFAGTHHLPRVTDVNAPQTNLLIENFRRFSATAANPQGFLPVSQAQALNFTVPMMNNAVYTVVIPGIIAINNATGLRFINPAVANFFRPNAPNYFLAQAISGGVVLPEILNSEINGTLRTPGVITPFGSVNAQLSDGNSNYNAMNIELERRFANNFTFLASYTLSHLIDDFNYSQNSIIRQDTTPFERERADSLLDQRHRFVFSSVLTSPAKWRNSNKIWKQIFSDFIVAPIIEFSSGRPFDITTADTINDPLLQNDRPNILPSGTICKPGETIGGEICNPIFRTDANNNLIFANGNLGRNKGITRYFASIDLRIARSVRFTERIRLELIAEGFNLLNRFNEASVSPNFRDVNSFSKRNENGQFYSTPTASYNQRQIQLGAKLFF